MKIGKLDLEAERTGPIEKGSKADRSFDLKNQWKIMKTADLLAKEVKFGISSQN